MVDLSHYDRLATVFDYPVADFGDRVAELVDALAESYPQASESLASFSEHLPVEDLEALRELYTRTFDVQAIATLDIGYTLFGDDYKRGAVLANLNAEHREAGNDCVTELADHLPNVLRLLPRLTDEAFRAELVRDLVAPAVRRMVIEFDAGRLKEKDLLYKKHYKTVIETAQAVRTVYGHALEALYQVLKKDFKLRVRPRVEQSSIFLRGLGTEMTTEACGDCASTP